jgi:hypothetical protein
MVFFFCPGSADKVMNSFFVLTPHLSPFGGRELAISQPLLHAVYWGQLAGSVNNEAGMGAVDCTRAAYGGRGCEHAKRGEANRGLQC